MKKFSTRLGSGLSFRFATLAFAALGLAFPAFADVPDLTDSLEFVGNPTLEKWSTPCYASSAMDLQAYRGKIYVGTGNYDANSGPSPVWAYDPFAAAFTNEITLGTEAIEIMRVLPDGRLYIPSIDPAGGEHNGSLFRKEQDGSWTVFPEYSAYCHTHMYDVELCQDKLFVCGYNTMKSEDYGVTWTNGEDDTWIYGNRLYSFVRCGDKLFSHCECQMTFLNDGSSYGNVYMLRLYGDMLECTSHSHLDYVAPDLKLSDTFIVMGDDVTTPIVTYRFWHPTPFGDRNLYVVGDIYTSRSYTSPVQSGKIAPTGTRPILAASGYATTNFLGKATLKADRIATPDGYYPIDFCVNGDAAYMLAFAYNSTDQNVRHGVWKTTDGTSFTQIISFDYQQVMMSMEYMDGYFYFGVTHKNAMIALGALKSGTSETAGSIYRVWCPQETLSVVAVPESDTQDEGTTKTIGFKLSAAPTTNLTLKVMARASQTVTLDKTSLTFTPENWSTAQSVNVTLVDDSVKDESKFHIICGANTDEIVHGECASPEVTPVVVEITPVDNDEEGGGGGGEEEPVVAPTITSVTVSEITTNGMIVTVAGSGLESTGSIKVAIYDSTGANAITNVTMSTWGSVTIAGLDPSTSYKVRVTASNGDKSTTADDVSATTTDVPVATLAWTTGVYSDGDYVEIANRINGGSSAMYDGTITTRGEIYTGRGVTNTFAEAKNLTDVRIYTTWDDRGRVGFKLANLRVQYSGSSDFVELAGTSIDYGVISSPTTNRLYAALTVANGYIASNVTAIAIIFETCQNGYIGVSEIEVAGVKTALPTIDHWVYDSTTETITDNAWTFNATLSGNDITVGTPLDDTTPSQCPTEITALDFSKPVVDGTNPSTTYTIVELSTAFGLYNKPVRASALCVGKVTMPGEGLVTVGDCAFRECENMTGDLVFPTTLKTVSRGAFMDTNVTSADFKAATVAINGGYSVGTFQHCTNLKWVRFSAGGNFTAPGGCLFPNCSSLGDADLSGVADVAISGDSHYPLFLNCSALTNVILNSNIVITNKGSGTIGNTLFKNNSKLATIRFTGAAPNDLQKWIDGDGGYLGCLSSSQAITTIVSNEFAEVKNSNGKSWADYAAGALNATDSTFASTYLVKDTTPANRKLILVTAPASGYDAWVAEIATGDDAAWDAKPSVWGGEWANAFIYTYGDGLTNDTRIMTISFDASGNPIITTPPVVEGRDDFTAVVIGTPDVKDWTNPIVLEATGNTWALPKGKSANFFRVMIEE